MQTLKVDPEFQSLIPPLTPDERAALEASLKAEGCRDAIVVWAGQGIILDGHNRYEICQAHGIEFRVHELELESRDHAIVWIVRNQLGRRNISWFAKDELVINALKPALVRIGLNRMKEASSNEVVKGLAQCAKPLAGDIQPHRTDAKLAEETGTSERGIRQSAYILQHAPEFVKEAARKQGISRRRAYELTRAIQELPEADRARAAEICIDHDEKARILVRLHKSQQGDPDSNGTYEEILRTGGFHYGDDMELWCDYAKADVETINKALKSLAKYHARLAAEERIHERAKIVSGVDTTSADVGLDQPSVLPGEWWKLGRHLLYCGDTSQRSFTESIGKAAFAFADPPYNAGVAPWDIQFTWAHDWLFEKAPIVAVTPGIASIFDFARCTSMPYAWAIACWVDNGMTRGALGFGNWIYIALFAKTSIHRNAQDFFRVSIKTSENDNTEHKGRKPSELIIRLLELFSREGETIIDPFLGSGTTLLVAEQMGRACIGGEINPEYCNEIVARWQHMTGMQAQKIGVVLDNAA